MVFRSFSCAESPGVPLAGVLPMRGIGKRRTGAGIEPGMLNHLFPALRERGE